MVIISTAYSELDKYIYKRSIITIGSFDGLHLGHQEIFHKMSALKLELPSNSLNNYNNKVLITFNPHPASILNKKKIEKGYFLTPFSSKIDLMKEHFDSFIDLILVISFTKDFSFVSAKDFFDKIIRSFDPSHIIIGDDHGFGHKREGNINFLKKNYEHGKQEGNLKIHQIKGKKNKELNRISSTLIRKSILNGKIHHANMMLNRKYSLIGRVVKGRGIGKQINFPTINIKPMYKNQIIPLKGVYYVSLETDKKKYKGMCNIGVRPTLTNSKEETIEIHIFRAEIDLDFYDKEVKILFIKYIRSEKKFKNIDFLVKQLERDRELCLSFEE